MSEGAPGNLSLRLLRAFVAVSREGHVGRAAASLYVSQPALSQDIRRLEREIGVLLFERSARGLLLTAAGEELLRGVEAALSILDGSVTSAQAIAVGNRVVFRIAYSPSMSNQLMPAMLPQLEREMVSLTVEEREVDTGEVGPGVLSGRYDAGFAHAPTPDARLKVSLVGNERLCVALSESHPLALAESIRLSDLSGLSLLIWPRESAPEYYDLILEICERGGLSVPEVKQFRHITPRTYLLDDNQTFSLLPISTATVQRPEVRFVDLIDESASVPLMFIQRAEDERPELKSIAEIARRVVRQTTS